MQIVLVVESYKEFLEEHIKENPRICEVVSNYAKEQCEQTLEEFLRCAKLVVEFCDGVDFDVKEKIFNEFSRHSVQCSLFVEVRADDYESNRDGIEEAAKLYPDLDIYSTFNCGWA